MLRSWNVGDFEVHKAYLKWLNNLSLLFKKKRITSICVEKFGQDCESLIIAIRSLQSIPKLWQIECWSMLSIAHLSTTTSIECDVEVYEPSTIRILYKLKTCGSSSACVYLLGGEGIVSFALYQAWHSFSAYLANFSGSLYMWTAYHSYPSKYLISYIYI